MSNRSIDIGLTYWTNLRRGSKSAFFEIYNSMYDDLYHYGLKICNDDALVRDLIQDLFVNLWKKHSVLPEIKAIKPYLLRMLRNMCIDEIKRYQKEEDLRNKYLFDQEEFQYVKDEPDQNHALIQELAKALNDLPARQREIIQLRYISDCSYEEISEVTGVSYQGVRNAVFKALKKLKQHFQ